MQTSDIQHVLQTFAQAQPGPGGFDMQIIIMVLIFVAFWFLLIAPQRKKQKQHAKMLQALEKGDKVKTAGGLFGTITGVKDDRFVLRIAENVKIEVAKDSVAEKLD
jgi:preprotein translocase subunit YajC